MRDEAVPALIRAAGEEAVKAYRSYFDDAIGNRNTRRNYASQARRFFEWAERRGLVLESIDAPALASYKAELAAATSPQAAEVYLVAVRGVFRALADTGVLAANPCPGGRLNGRRPTGPDPAEEPVSLEELKQAVRELDDWEEDSELFRAGLVVLAPAAIETTDPAAVAAFTGVPEPLVHEFAARLRANGVWLPDGKFAMGSKDVDSGVVEVIINVLIAVGDVERRPAAGADGSQDAGLHPTGQREGGDESADAEASDAR